MVKRVAALDLGTNTFHLIIADVIDHEIKSIILSDQKHIKLGEGGITDGLITESAFQRGLQALSQFQKVLAHNKVDTIRAVGTAALRTAVNGNIFIQQVKERTGIEIEIISGEQEALLIYQGVKQAVNLTESSLIMDIGGGSVEFIIANTTGIQWKKSYPIGAAKLMEVFHNSDPISEKEISAIYSHLDGTLTDLKLKSKEYKPKILVGSAGAFETFAALCQIKSDGTQSGIVKSFAFDNGILDSVISDLIHSSHVERHNNKAILPVRTDMIVVASILTEYIIKQLDISSVMMTTYALKEGLLIAERRK